MKRLPPKDPSERIVIAFDFGRRLADDATLLAPAVQASVASGEDEDPGAIVSGAAAVIGSRVLQLIVVGADRTDYRLRCQVETSDGQRFVVSARLPVRDL